MPAPIELLDAYLNDHLAGATAGVELAETVAEDSRGLPLDALMHDLVAEIQADRKTLLDLMARLGIEPHTAKQVGAATVEKLSRLRFHPRVTRSRALTLFMQVEVLSVGIEGKLLLWLALTPIADAYPEVAATDLETLISRARKQREDLAPYRLAMGAQAFGGGGAGGADGSGLEGKT